MESRGIRTAFFAVRGDVATAAANGKSAQFALRLHEARSRSGDIISRQNTKKTCNFRSFSRENALVLISF